MKALWGRLEAWAEEHADKSLRLRPGASERAVKAAEKAMKLELPADLRASILLHDGQEPVDEESELFPWMPGCSPLASLEWIVERWKEERDEEGDAEDDAVSEDGFVHTTLWHPSRVPLAGTPDWDGDNTYVDLYPGPQGTRGQLITFVTECDLTAIAPSLAAALESYVGALERGDWIYKNDDVRPKRRGSGHPADLFAEYVKKLKK
jgi:cell wall assembly regulator SMI1